MSDGKYWTHARNWVVGCRRMGPECEQCWAAATVHRFGLGSTSLTVETQDGINWSGAVEEREPPALPVHGAPQVIAINWLGDLGYSGVTDEQAFDVFDRVMINVTARAQAKQSPHAYLFLTHRPRALADRAARWISETAVDKLHGRRTWVWDAFYEAVWWGATVVRQDQLEDAAVLDLLPGNHWLSVEPIDSPVAIGDIIALWQWVTAGTSTTDPAMMTSDRRDMLRALARECAAGGVPIWIKQLGRETVPSEYRQLPSSLEVLHAARAAARRRRKVEP